MYMFMFLSLHTHKYTKTQQTQTKAAAKQVMIKLIGGKKKREIRKGCNKCALCTISRDFRNGSNKRVCYFFGCARRQSISNSVQIRAVNLCRTWYVCIFYIFLSIIHTQIHHIQMDGYLHKSVGWMDINIR